MTQHIARETDPAEDAYEKFDAALLALVPQALRGPQKFTDSRGLGQLLAQCPPLPIVMDTDGHNSAHAFDAQIGWLLDDRFTPIGREASFSSSSTLETRGGGDIELRDDYMDANRTLVVRLFGS